MRSLAQGIFEAIWLAARCARTGVELLASVGERALVVYLDAVAGLRPSVALDLLGDIDLQLGGAGRQSPEGGRHHEGQGQEAAHFR